ncbi:hypothetical protein MKX01_037634 [Papaver californicum]|nr:hypothetical protein MKX01_037634 [Papaver californicum]
MASLFFTRILRVYTYSSSTKSSLSSSLTIYNQCRRSLRSKTSLKSLITAAENTPNLILNNNPSYSDSYSAIFAHLYYTHLQIPHLNFPFPSNKLLDMELTLVRSEDRDRIETVLKNIEDSELNKWNLPDIKAFNISLKEERRKLNCITNPYMFDQLLELDPTSLITRGNLLDKPFKIHLGRGFYGECLGIRADGNSNLSNDIGKKLSLRSAAAGLRPIVTLIPLKLLRAYGEGDTSASSSIIRMDEYSQWISGCSHKVAGVL